MRKVFTAAGVFLGSLALLFVAAASGGTDHNPTRLSGSGETFSHTQELRLGAGGNIKLTTVQQVCKVGYYTDGAVHARPCNTRDYEQGNTKWWSRHRLVWNVPGVHGGHSDIFSTDTCWYVGTGSECYDSFILDGETDEQGTDRSSGFSTAWVHVENSAGGYYPGYCKRYFFNWTGGASTSSC